jgi:hypothetical protein
VNIWRSQGERTACATRGRVRRKGIAYGGARSRDRSQHRLSLETECTKHRNRASVQNCALSTSIALVQVGTITVAESPFHACAGSSLYGVLPKIGEHSEIGAAITTRFLCGESVIQITSIQLLHAREPISSFRQPVFLTYSCPHSRQTHLPIPVVFYSKSRNLRLEASGL